MDVDAITTAVTMAVDATTGSGSSSCSPAAETAMAVATDAASEATAAAGSSCFCSAVATAITSLAAAMAVATDAAADDSNRRGLRPAFSYLSVQNLLCLIYAEIFYQPCHIPNHTQDVIKSTTWSSSYLSDQFVFPVSFCNIYPQISCHL